MEQSDSLLDSDAISSVRYLLENPYLIGHCIGFNDLGILHSIWIKEIVFGVEDFTLQAHRGSYKSSCLSVALALFMILFPTRNIIFLRKTDSDVIEMMSMISKALKSEVFHDIVSLLYEKELSLLEETQTSIITNLFSSPSGASQIRGLGIKSSITGSHAWLVVTDDICNLSDRISRAERERTKLQYNELQNIRNRGGRIINIGTPWHKEDVFSLMPNIHRYDCYTTGLISDEKLDFLRKSMPPALFAANYELKHIASEEALFTDSPIFFDDDGLLKDGISHIDASYGGSDFTAFSCGRKKDDIIYIYGKLWKHHIKDVLSNCIALADRFSCWPLYCEDNGDKGFVYTEIRRLDRWSKCYHESMNKYVKIASFLKAWYPNIRFHRETDPAYLEQILDYTVDAAHDDAPDSAACIVRLLDKHRRLF